MSSEDKATTPTPSGHAKCGRCGGPPQDITGMTYSGEGWGMVISNPPRELRICLDCMEAIYRAVIGYFPFTDAEADHRAIRGSK